jgi:phage baseplate assembly protein W
MAKDIQLNPEGDLEIANGDLQIAVSDQQHVQDVLITTLGANKAAPLLGVGIINELMMPQTGYYRQRLKREITRHLRADGAVNVVVNVADTITAVAQYEE